jgi:pSer/pThr/pTyr-binding forkhead associated (FHA) protein
MRLLRRLSERLRDRLEAEARAAEIAMAPLRHRVARAAGVAVEPRSVVVATGPGVLIHESGKEFRLDDGDEWVVGRADRAAGTRPPVDLTELDTDRLLSRQHALIVRRDLAYFVRENKASRNGTFVNGARLTAGLDHRLEDGDEVRFASVAMLFRHR